MNYFKWKCIKEHLELAVTIMNKNQIIFDNQSFSCIVILSDYYN